MKFLKRILMASVLAPQIVFAQNLNQGVGLSIKGQSGLIMIPSAQVAHFGTFTYGRNQFLMPRYNPDQQEGENFFVNIGALHGLEATLRLHEVHRLGHDSHAYGDFTNRDLSSNIKYQLPIRSDYWKFALGAQDVAGLAVQEKRYYGVTSLDWKNFSFSAGYAQAPDTRHAITPDHLEGLFYGVQYAPLEGLNLLLDHDGFYNRAAVRVDLSNLLNTDIDIALQWNGYSSQPQESTSLALAFSIPLAGRPTSTVSTRPTPEAAAVPVVDKTSQLVATSATVTATKVPAFTPILLPKTAISSQLVVTAASTTHEPEADAWQQLSQKLTKLGLDNIRFGTQEQGRVLVLAYENRSHAWSELEGLAAALVGLAQANIEHYKSVKIITLRDDMPVLLTQATPQWIAFNGRGLPKKYSAQSMTMPKFEALSVFSDDYQQTDWHHENGQHEWLKTVFRPLISNTVGTELGVFDYSLAMQTQLHTRLWSGARAIVARQDPLANSYQFDDNQYFAASRHKSEDSFVFLEQILPWAPGVVTLASYGRMLYERGAFDVALQETHWYAGQGRHHFHYRNGFATDNANHDNVTFKNRDFWAAGYEWFLPNSDLALSYEYGKLFYGDESRNIGIKTYIGDSQVGFNMIESDTGWQKSQVSITVPLTPRKNYELGLLTVSGYSHWRYAIETITDDPQHTGRNTVGAPPFGLQIYPPVSAHTDVMDMGRLTPAYMSVHIRDLVNVMQEHDLQR